MKIFMITLHTYLLHIVGEIDQAVRRSGVGHHHEYFGTPELDVTLPYVQPEEVLSDLVVDEGLRDVAPGRSRTAYQEVDKEEQHHSYIV